MHVGTFLMQGYYNLSESIKIALIVKYNKYVKIQGGIYYGNKNTIL